MGFLGQVPRLLHVRGHELGAVRQLLQSGLQKIVRALG